MRGFASSALILLPSMEDYTEAYGGYKEQLHKAVRNLLTYLKAMEITPTFFVTDQLATTLYANEAGVAWQATENPGGMYFLQNNMNIPVFERLRPIPPVCLQDIDKKFPVERGLSGAQRQYTEAKRVNRAEKLIIETQPVVFMFGKQYSLRSKPDDGRALFFINSQFIPKLKLSGYDANINAFLGFPGANMALTEWRVTDG